MTYDGTIAAGFESVQASKRDTTGVLTGFAGLTATDTNTYSGMRRIVGGNAFAVTRGKRVKVSPKGDNRVLGTFSFGPSDPQEFALTLAEKSLTLNNALTGMVNDTIAGGTIHGGIPAIIKSAAMVWLMSRDTIDEDTGAQGFMHYLVFNAGAEESDEALNFQAEAQFGYSLTPNESLIMPYGLLSSAVNGVVKNLYATITTQYRLTFGCYIGDGTSTDIVVDQTPIDVAHTTVFVEGSGVYTEAAPSSVTPGTKTIVLSAAPGSGKHVIVAYQFREWE